MSGLSKFGLTDEDLNDFDFSLPEGESGAAPQESSAPAPSDLSKFGLSDEDVNDFDFSLPGEAPKFEGPEPELFQQLGLTRSRVAELGIDQSLPPEEQAKQAFSKAYMAPFEGAVDMIPVIGGQNVPAAADAVGGFVEGLFDTGSLEGAKKAAGEAFDQTRENVRTAREEAAEQFSGQYRFGQLASLAASMPAQSLNTVKGLAFLGAVDSAARTDAENLADLGVDTAVGGAVGGALGALPKGYKAIKESKVGEFTGKAFDKVAGAPKRLLRKIVSEISGIPEDDITRYAKRATQINERYAKAGDKEVQTVVENERRALMQSIRRFRQSANKKIDDFLNISPKSNRQVSVQSVQEALNNQIRKVDADIQPEVIEVLEQQLALLEKLKVGGARKVPLRRLYKFQKQIAQKSTFDKNGQLFPIGKDGQKLLKEVGAEARKIITREAPELDSALKKLSKLHQIENVANRAIFKENAAAAAFLRAGAKGTRENVTARAIDRTVGTQLADAAADIRAGKYFIDPKLFNEIATGRTGLAAGAGAVGASVLDTLLPGEQLSGVEGAAAGFLLSSPAVIRKAIGVDRALRSLGRGAAATLRQRLQQATTPATQAAVIQQIREALQDENKRD